MNSTEAFSSRFCKFKSILRVPSVDVLIALVTSALMIAVKNLNGKVSLESANDMPNILMKFLLPFCSCNKTWMTDILNVKKTLNKVLPSTTLCTTPPTLQILIPRHHYFTIW